MKQEIDLRFLDDLFEGRGLYHPAARAGTFLKETRIHLVLLNWELLPGPQLLKLLRAAVSISCADGGANRLLERLNQFDLPTIADVFYIQGTAVKKPLFIIGDLDSYMPIIDKTTGTERPLNTSLQKFGFEVVKIQDEYSTDFDKVRATLETRRILQDNDTMLVDGAFGGRFDQVTATISSLYQSYWASTRVVEHGKRATKFSIYLLGEESVCTLIPPGRNLIHPPVKIATRVCGLLPYVPVKAVTTEGLKWDVKDTPMAMDGLVSSSNEVLASDGVCVSCSEPLIWFSNLKPF